MPKDTCSTATTVMQYSTLFCLHFFLTLSPEFVPLKHHISIWILGSAFWRTWSKGLMFPTVLCSYGWTYVQVSLVRCTWDLDADKSNLSNWPSVGISCSMCFRGNSIMDHLEFISKIHEWHCHPGSVEAVIFLLEKSHSVLGMVSLVSVLHSFWIVYNLIFLINFYA